MSCFLLILDAIMYLPAASPCLGNHVQGLFTRHTIQRFERKASRACQVAWEQSVGTAEVEIEWKAPRAVPPVSSGTSAQRNSSRAAPFVWGSAAIRLLAHPG